jgi:hypothetical protein
LTGIDWLVGAMGHTARKSTGVGGFSQAILDVEGVVEEKTLRAALDQISSRFPLIHGRVARDWINLAPYWRISQSPGRSVIPLRVADLAEDDAGEAERMLDDHVNAPFDSEWQHLRVLLVRLGRRRSRIGLVFDHRMLDAFGAETFFRLLDLCWQGRVDEIAARVKQTEPAHVDQWVRRFQSGRTLNQMLLKLKDQNVRGLRMPPAGVFRPVRFVNETLSVQETAAFVKMAGEEISVPILLPSATARAILAVRQACAARLLPGTHYTVFTSANLRPVNQEWESFLFNHFSLMPFYLEADAPDCMKQAAIELRDQFLQHMKQQLPFAMADAAALGRICPHWIGSKLLGLVAGGRMCSFYFACLRETGFSGETFMGLPTVNLIHTPLVFCPPGLNICMTYFRGRFNLVVSYVRDALDDRIARRLMRIFKSSLLE